MSTRTDKTPAEPKLMAEKQKHPIQDAVCALERSRFVVRKVKEGASSIQFKKERELWNVHGYLQRTVCGWEWRTCRAYANESKRPVVHKGCEPQLRDALNKVLFAEGDW